MDPNSYLDSTDHDRILKMLKAEAGCLTPGSGSNTPEIKL